MNDGDSQPKRGGAALGPRRLLPIAVLAAGLIAFFALDLGHYLSLEVLRENRELLMRWVERYGVAAGAIYIVVYAVATTFSVPGGAVMTIVGGFLFGPLLATVLTVFAATVGATGLFLAARYAFADYLRAKAGPAMRRMERGFNENALNYLLFLRLIPVFPFWLVNLVPAFLGVRLGTFVLGTVIGIIPGSLVYALVGDGLGAVLDADGDLDLGIIFAPRFLVPVVALAVLALAPVVYKKLKGRAR